MRKPPRAASRVVIGDPGSSSGDSRGGTVRRRPVPGQELRVDPGREDAADETERASDRQTESTATFNRLDQNGDAKVTEAEPPTR